MSAYDPAQPNLFHPVSHQSYPESAGWKRTDTSRAAAESLDAATVRGEVLRWLRQHGAHTADETAAALEQSVLTVRPRFSELRALGRIVDTGARRVNTSSGKSAIVWAAS